FSVRTLLRSRQHRTILAFYLGIAFAVTIFFLKSPAAQRQLFEAPASDPWRQVSTPALAASMVIWAFGWLPRDRDARALACRVATLRDTRSPANNGRGEAT